jgi:protein TonB
VTGAKPAARPAASAPAAATIGPAVRSSLASSISRQLKPRWQAPQGPDAEELVTILSFNLNRDGTLAGTPTVVRQLGINDTNRNQADRHAEQAIKAVRLAAPFDLPAEYYDAWKRVSQFRFDKRLSQ